MDSEKSKEQKIEELKHVEAQLQNLLAQKQNLQIELNEIDNALNELKNSGEEVYKIVSGVMLKSDKESVEKGLKEKKKEFEVRIEAIEKQQDLIEKRSSEIRKEIDSSLNSTKN